MTMQRPRLKLSGRRQVLIQHPIISLILVAIGTSVILTVCAIYFVRVKMIPEQGSIKNLQDVATVYQGIIGSAVSLSGSLVAIFIATAALRAVRRQEFVDSQVYLEQYIGDIYKVFTSLSIAVDSIIDMSFKFITDTTRPVSKEIASRRGSPDTDIDQITSHISDDDIISFLSKFSDEIDHLYLSLERVVLNPKSLAVWHHCLIESGRPIIRPSVARVEPILGDVALLEIPTNSNTLGDVLLFLRHISLHYKESIRKSKVDENFRIPYLGQTKNFMVLALEGFHHVANSSDGTDNYYRFYLNVMGYLIMNGDPTYWKIITGRPHADIRNVSLLCMQRVLLGIPDRNTMASFIKRHLHDETVIHSQEFELSLQYMANLEEIISSNIGYRRYLCKLSDEDILLRRPFLGTVLDAAPRTNTKAR